MVRKTASLLAIAGLLSLGAAGGALAQTSNPCATKNPGAAKTAGAVKDPAAEAAFKQYKRWKKVNPDPVLSASHGNRYVFTYLNKTAEPAGLQGTFPFPKGAVLAKKSFEAQDGKPGSQGPLFHHGEARQGLRQRPRLLALGGARAARCRLDERQRQGRQPDELLRRVPLRREGE